MLHIVIDTREQTPWHFHPEVATATRGTIKTGDYALLNDDGFAIERKSLNDFVGTIGKGWDRFCREIKRMDGWRAPGGTGRFACSIRAGASGCE